MSSLLDCGNEVKIKQKIYWINQL